MSRSVLSFGDHIQARGARIETAVGTRMALALIGFRGVGKTTIARRLAERLGWDWRDADDELERRAGKTIRAIFAEQGEPAFRDLEAQVIADLLPRERLVVATGGGCVLREDNRAQLAGCSAVVWLTADVDAIHQRLTTDTSTAERRPQLTHAPPREEIELLLAAREPLYRQAATFKISTTNRPPDELVDQIMAHLAQASPAGGGPR